jgi:hypothetical protein
MEDSSKIHTKHEEKSDDYRHNRHHYSDNREPTRHLWVGRLHGMRVDYHTLMRDFQRFGEIESLNLLKDQKCAFVNFRKTEDAERAKRHLEGVKYPKIAFQKTTKKDYKGETIYKSANKHPESVNIPGLSTSTSTTSPSMMNKTLVDSSEWSRTSEEETKQHHHSHHTSSSKPQQSVPSRDDVDMDLG